MRNILTTNNNSKHRVITVDRFYQYPDQVRDIGLQQIFYPSETYIGDKSESLLFEGVKEAFEELLDERIVNWETGNKFNGSFQSITSGNISPVEYSDSDWFGIIFLTPDAPPESGITLQRHKETKVYHAADKNMSKLSDENMIDKFRFEQMDILGNVYNRLVLIDGRLLRSYSEYFGDIIPNGFFSQIFYFDTEKTNDY